jgi:hypothetical protein
MEQLARETSADGLKSGSNPADVDGPVDATSAERSRIGRERPERALIARYAFSVSLPDALDDLLALSALEPEPRRAAHVDEGRRRGLDDP